MKFKKIKKIFIRLVNVVFCVFLLGSCASTAKYEGTANLMGMIIDENNRPVSNFSVTVSGALKTYDTVVTNDGGIFTVKNVESGNLSFYGKKEGYTVLNQKDIYNRKDRVMCIQIYSVDYVLDMADENARNENYSEALNNLKDVYTKHGSNIDDVVSFYKKKLTQKKKEMKDAKNEKN